MNKKLWKRVLGIYIFFFYKIRVSEMLLCYQHISGLLGRQLISAKFSQRVVDVRETT